jgi:hypothetical protein
LLAANSGGSFVGVTGFVAGSFFCVVDSVAVAEEPGAAGAAADFAFDPAGGGDFAGVSALHALEAKTPHSPTMTKGVVVFMVAYWWPTKLLHFT